HYHTPISDMVASGADFNRAYARDPVSAYKPCLGKVFVLEECEGSTKLLRRSARAGFLVAEAPLAALSFRDRYLEVFRRLLSDRMYDAIWYEQRDGRRNFPSTSRILRWGSRRLSAQLPIVS